MTEREEEERKKCLYYENPEKPWQCKKPHSCFLAMILSGVWEWQIILVFPQCSSAELALHNSVRVDEDEKLKINWRRVATTSLFGFGFVGPVGHFWYEGLDQVMKSRLHLQPKSMRFVASKVALDGIIFGPLDLLVFFSYMGFSSGKSATQVKEDVKRDFIPAFVLEGGIWPLLQVANFRFVPVRYQLLYVNLFCLLDSCFLSWVEQQQDAPWKQWFKSFLVMKEEEGQGG
ncbi:hypothetical protein RHGRI_020791 [Rhododendron griersonianum]|uniref:PXMP2/4 family protein 2 n=1 Tax=Rhododendron griersonianum TaxID=479676 RepID=A0AAV6JQ42_9ERIC|nr:hypothetical protein RHGRI_020791 [Rhododendron griersonianum]KAG5540679.1 hypothetical protein RHGRI_020791 [Rhododendron griersonianum]